MHSLSHVTGGGIAANLARVLPRGSWVELDRSTWSPAPVFRVLNDLAGTTLESTEGTWNLGIGFFAVVAADAAAAVIAAARRARAPGLAGGHRHDRRLATSTGSSRARRASTAAPCASSARYAG